MPTDLPGIYSRAELATFLQTRQLSALKGLGQHFLTSESAVASIVRAVGQPSSVLEVGPGPGILTRPLTHVCDAVHAIELDERMIAAIRETLPSVTLHPGDALQLDFHPILAAMPPPRALVSNLPYYITGPLLNLFAQHRHAFDTIVLMMQREVADRIRADHRHPDRGSLSVWLQAQFQIALVAQVPAGAFLPPPKVDSTVLKFVPRAVPDALIAELDFALRIGFAQRRKTLANNLVAGLRCDRAQALAWLADQQLLPTVRPQELTVDAWQRLASTISAWKRASNPGESAPSPSRSDSPPLA
ncbi:MAG: 16S rRNA (adenine(1518)-N(6)/adenine(1519)-N(6))-dimethyltransferase RsmA [Fimbriimonadaceae bacterium]|nr:16S rRNA (adenine(1518)-N(6)/adenine(1519)-N(6))-dimethyltransferase RsmA [Fimbriimonadaceae bacterium]